MGRNNELHEMWEKQADELSNFTDLLRPRQDWHEPDEQGIEATVHGDHLDNAFGDSLNFGEFVIELSNPDSDACPVIINLADLLAHYCYMSDKHYKNKI